MSFVGLHQPGGNRESEAVVQSLAEPQAGIDAVGAAVPPAGGDSRVFAYVWAYEW